MVLLLNRRGKRCRVSFKGRIASRRRCFRNASVIGGMRAIPSARSMCSWTRMRHGLAILHQCGCEFFAIGITLPDFPLLAESWRQMARPISPWASLVIHQVSRAISFARRPALADNRKIKWFLSGRRVLAKYPQNGLDLAPARCLRLLS